MAPGNNGTTKGRHNSVQIFGHSNSLGLLSFILCRTDEPSLQNKVKHSISMTKLLVTSQRIHSVARKKLGPDTLCPTGCS